MINISKLSSNIKKLKEIADHSRLTKKSEEGELKGKQFFDEKKLYIKNIAKDPNNVYRAFSDALYYTQSRYAFIKLNLVEYIESTHNQFSLLTEAFCQMDVNEFISHLRKGSVEPMLELLVLCEKFKKNLHLIYSECMHQKWEVKEKIFDFGQRSSVKLYLNMDGYFDAVYNVTFIKSAGVCQSILYDIFDSVFLEGGDLSPKEQHFAIYKNVEFQNWKSQEDEKKRAKLQQRRTPKNIDGTPTPSSSRALDLSHDIISKGYFDSLFEDDEHNESTIGGNQRQIPARKELSQYKSMDFDTKYQQNADLFTSFDRSTLNTSGAKSIQPFNFSQPRMTFSSNTFAGLRPQNPPPGFEVNPSVKNFEGFKGNAFAGLKPPAQFQPQSLLKGMGELNLGGANNFAMDREKRMVPKRNGFSDTNVLANFRMPSMPKEEMRFQLDTEDRAKEGSKNSSNGSSLNQSREHADTSPRNRSFEKENKPQNTSTSAIANNTINEFGNESGQILPPPKTLQPFFNPTRKLYGSGLQNTLQDDQTINKRSISSTGLPQLTQLNYPGYQPQPPQQNMSTTNVTAYMPNSYLQPQNPQQQQMFMPQQQPLFKPTAQIPNMMPPSQPMFQPQQKPMAGVNTQTPPAVGSEVPVGELPARTTGRLKFFDENQNYGFFVQDSDNSDLFVHYDDLRKANMTKETLRKAKNGYVLKFSFIPMSYYGKYSLSRKAIEIELIGIEPIYPQQPLLGQQLPQMMEQMAHTQQ